MFLHLCVILFQGGEGVGFPACITGHMSRIQGGLHPEGLPTGGFPMKRGSAYRGRAVCLQGDRADPPPPGTRKAGGMHPTGMLSCS